MISESGKETIVAIHGPNEFCGEGCLTGHGSRLSSAVAMAESEIMRLEKADAIRLLHDEPAFSEMFIARQLNSYRTR